MVGVWVQRGCVRVLYLRQLICRLDLPKLMWEEPCGTGVAHGYEPREQARFAKHGVSELKTKSVLTRLQPVAGLVA